MSSLMRVLFVDDEVAILDSMRALLRKDRARWDMAFVDRGSKALDLIAAQPFDVVVTDMRLPCMSGVELLSRIKAVAPGTTRLVLSGQADRETVLRTVPVAHRFLSKPYEFDQLRSALERATKPSDPAIRAVVNNLDLGIIAPLIEGDPADAKVLQGVESAYFGRPTVTPIARVGQLIGIDLVRELAAPWSRPDLSFAGLQMSASLTARLAAAMLGGSKSATAAFTAALLRDVGEIALALAPELAGTDHAAIGSHLLGLWGLPQPIVDAVAFHHRPQDAPGDAALDVIAAVHVADALVDRDGESIDEAFLARVGGANRWRELADAA